MNIETIRRMAKRVQDSMREVDCLGDSSHKDSIELVRRRLEREVSHLAAGLRELEEKASA